MRVLGYVHRSERTRLDCHQPVRAVCHDCPYETFWRCNCSSETKCPDCAERRRKLIARIVDLGTSQRLGTGYTYFLTLTGPGSAEHLLTYQGKKPAKRPKCDCHRVWEHLSMGDWNKQESANWNRLRTSLGRLVGSLTYIGSVEVQDGKRRADGIGRGALHRHIVLNVDRPLTQPEVQALAVAAGYGCMTDLQLIQSASKAAWYISKYVTKSSGDRENVPWRADVVDKRTGEVTVMNTTPTYRTWSAAQSWGYTLKGLREISRLQAAARHRYLEELAAAIAAESPQTPAGAPVATCATSPP